MKKVKKEDSVSAEALDLVYHNRDQQYGDVHDNFSKIGRIAQELLNVDEWILLQSKKISPSIIAKICMALKLARESNRSKRDNRVDLIGYTECYDQVLQHEEDLLNKQIDEEENKNGNH
jgi:hypothetical protein